MGTTEEKDKNVKPADVKQQPAVVSPASDGGTDTESKAATGGENKDTDLSKYFKTWEEYKENPGFKDKDTDSPPAMVEENHSLSVPKAEPASKTIPYTVETLIKQMEDAKKAQKTAGKEERRKKIEGIVAGVSDAAQAISNLIFTSKYAPNMYNPKTGMSAKLKERLDKEKAEREKNKEAHLRYALELGKQKETEKQREQKAKQWQEEQELKKQELENKGKQWAAEFEQKDKFMLIGKATRL